MLLVLELNPCRTLCSGDVVCVRISDGLLGKESTELGLMYIFLTW